MRFYAIRAKKFVLLSIKLCALIKAMFQVIMLIAILMKNAMLINSNQNLCKHRFHKISYTFKMLAYTNQTIEITEKRFFLVCFGLLQCFCCPIVSLVPADHALKLVLIIKHAISPSRNIIANEQLCSLQVPPSQTRASQIWVVPHRGLHKQILVVAEIVVKLNFCYRKSRIFSSQ